MLLVNTWLAQGSFTVHQLQLDAVDLRRPVAGARAVDRRPSAPQALAARAMALGMVAAPNPVFKRTSTARSSARRPAWAPPPPVPQASVTPTPTCRRRLRSRRRRRAPSPSATADRRRQRAVGECARRRRPQRGEAAASSSAGEAVGTRAARRSRRPSSSAAKPSAVEQYREADREPAVARDVESAAPPPAKPTRRRPAAMRDRVSQPPVAPTAGTAQRADRDREPTRRTGRRAPRAARAARRGRRVSSRVARARRSAVAATRHLDGRRRPPRGRRASACPPAGCTPACSSSAS